MVKLAENLVSFGVSVLEDSKNLVQACQDTAQWTHEYLHGIPFSNEILIQEYILGREFSVEGISFSGQYWPWEVSMKFTTPGKVQRNRAYFPSPIDTHLRDEILAVVK